MANEFRIKHGLILTGSSYFSESMFAPSLPSEPSPQYFMTWRSADGRFQVTPSTAISTGTLSQGCWDYAGYATSVSAGEFSIRSGNGNRLDSNLSQIWIHKTDNQSVDQSTTFNTIGNNSVITFYINNQIIKYTVTGVTQVTTGNYYSFGLSHISGDSGVFSVGEELCYDLTISSSGGSPSSNNCLSLNMGDSVSNVSNTTGDAIFNRNINNKAWQTPFGTVDNNITQIVLNSTDLNNKNVFNFFTGFTGDISISYSNSTTGTSHNTTFSYSGFGASNNVVQLYVAYKSGNTGYTIANNDSFTLCKI